MPNARRRQLLRPALAVGGLITGLIGIGHIFMPVFGYDGAVPLSMPPAERAHFYYLGTYAICGFLLSFAVLSLHFARSDQVRAARAVCAVLALFWTGRAILEVLYPVDLRLFVLASPHTVLLPVIGFLALTYAAGAISGWTAAD